MKSGGLVVQRREGETHEERMKEKDKDGWGRDEEKSRWEKTSSEEYNMEQTFKKKLCKLEDDSVYAHRVTNREDWL